MPRGQKIRGWYDHPEDCYWWGSRDGMYFVHYDIEVLWAVDPNDNRDGRDRSHMTNQFTWRVATRLGLTLTDKIQAAEVGALLQLWTYGQRTEMCRGCRYTAIWRLAKASIKDNINVLEVGAIPATKPEQADWEFHRLDDEWRWGSYEECKRSGWPPIRWRGARYWSDWSAQPYQWVDLTEFFNQLHVPESTTLTERRHRDPVPFGGSSL